MSRSDRLENQIEVLEQIIERNGDNVILAEIIDTLSQLKEIDTALFLDTPDEAHITYLLCRLIIGS